MGSISGRNDAVEMTPRVLQELYIIVYFKRFYHSGLILLCRADYGAPRNCKENARYQIFYWIGYNFMCKALGCDIQDVTTQKSTSS